MTKNPPRPENAATIIDVSREEVIKLAGGNVKKLSHLEHRVPVPHVVCQLRLLRKGVGYVASVGGVGRVVDRRAAGLSRELDDGADSLPD